MKGRLAFVCMQRASRNSSHNGRLLVSGAAKRDVCSKQSSTLLAAVASSGAARGNSVERDSQECRTRTQEASQERGEVGLETMTEVNVSI